MEFEIFRVIRPNKNKTANSKNIKNFGLSHRKWRNHMVCIRHLKIYLFISLSHFAGRYIQSIYYRNDNVSSFRNSISNGIPESRCHPKYGEWHPTRKNGGISLIDFRFTTEPLTTAQWHCWHSQLHMHIVSKMFIGFVKRSLKKKCFWIRFFLFPLHIIFGPLKNVAKDEIEEWWYLFRFMASQQLIFSSKRRTILTQ